MEKVFLLLKKELEVVWFYLQINCQVNVKLEEYQCQFFFCEQFKIIQKELGIIKDDKESDVDEFCKCMENYVILEVVMKKIDDEFSKFVMLELGLLEYVVICNYLDWVIFVFWGVILEDKLDIDNVCVILDKYYDGLDDVKDCIVEFFVVGVYRGQISGFILLLVGLFGVGKIFIGCFIVDVLGWKFYCFSLGGMCDEVEIKGYC